MQNAKNYIRWYIPHHFIYYPITLLLLGISIYMALHRPEDQLVWTLFAISTFIILITSFMMRQHYALVLQNRLVRQEVSSRYFELSGQRFAQLEEALSFSQIASLRFAGDDELVALAQQAVAKQMDSKAIVHAIQHWRADHNRV